MLERKENPVVQDFQDDWRHSAPGHRLDQGPNALDAHTEPEGEAATTHGCEGQVHCTTILPVRNTASIES